MGKADPLKATANYDAAADESPGEVAPVAADMAAARLPERIGRYRIERVLGKGGFGLVYLAQDEQLSRPVAIKVPHRKLVDRREVAEPYLTEARTVANLDHPHIVPVFDVGSTEQFPCFVVSKYIDGTDLATRLKESRLSILGTVDLVATVAEALHHAHKQGLVHRDIKPGNILLDKSAKPFVADFGLALKDEDFGKGSGLAGTPAYMSPEQARGEGHRVDGRSDIFSLGVVFYELLTGKRPFRGDSLAEVIESITTTEPRPPRQIDDTIPKELERICQKALSKRASERYSTAKDMAEDLRLFLQTTAAAVSPLVPAGAIGTPPGSTLESAPLPATSRQSDSGERPIRIVPRGLRSFDEHDADFFLALLPGPRDRDGLPDSIQFWKRKIEQIDPDLTFKVGLIYGPSGCGKSSLVKAGLLPRLREHVLPVYIEATADETEARLLKRLRKVCPELARESGLVDSLASLRRGRALPPERKVLLVLDQFEQWLHAKRGEEETELVAALRQCDGAHVQAIVMVRDDFWLAASRFMRDLEIRLVEGENSALVDLFDPRHARKVLMAFGRAYGALPETVADLGRDQEPFLDQAISGLAQDGKIIPVRLALFAEMIKGKPWTPATLEEVGGTEGMGLTFLEETFSVSTAPPEHRLHQKAAQAVLKALLPETGTDIKGQMRSRQELLAASGYATRPKDFDDLIRILDSEIRLITPTDPEGVAGDEWRVEGESTGNRPGIADGAVNPATRHSPPTTRYYQLTHDYLVHSLREWLTRKQKESRRGRAELTLADRAAVWNARPENRQLPSLLQWFTIRWQTQKKTWTPPQKKMMAKAGKYHAVQGLVLAVVLALAGWGGYEGHGTLKAHALRDRLLDANTNEVPTIVADMGSYRRWINPLLYEAYGKAERDKDSRKQLHAGLALLPVDPSQVTYLYDRLLDAEPHEVPVIRDALAPHKDELLEKLWEVVEKPKKGKESQRLRAAAALAKYDPESESWAQASGPVVEQLVGENPVFLGLWMEGFRPIKGKLLASLEGIYRNPNSRESERTLATNILADYAAQQPEVLADLLMDADEKQFPVIYAKFKDRGEQGVLLLTAVIDTKLPADLPSSDDKRETLAKRQGNAAMALLRMDQPAKVWPLLKHSPDPRVRSYLINRLGPLGADAQAIIKRLDEEPDISARRALLLSLGEVSETEFTPDARKAMLPKLQEIYRTESDPGLHAASEWLLRTWKQVAWLKQVNDEWAKDKVKGEGWWVVGKDKDSPPATRHSPPTTPKWYVNTQGQTMVVIPGPVEFLMGSPTTEKNRGRFEPQHKKRIGRTFALAATSVTKEQFLRFQPKFWGNQMMRYPEPTCPIGGVNWYEAAAYCNWLSKDEGISEEQWCYEIKGPETKLKEKYLSLTGYRLPTEAEMEYAIRAGALTSRYYGETEELLPKYAWYVKNSQERTWPVGSLKANDLGLFDVYGNLITWCQERYKEYPAGKGDQAVEDQEDGLVVKDTDSRVLRGGTFVMQASAARSANRNNAAMPTFGNYAIGFRPARTLPLSSFTALPPTAAGGRK